jgi:hypothetical protein
LGWSKTEMERERKPEFQTSLGYGGPRRRILKATAALKSLRLFARVHGGGLRAERIPTYLCEEVFSGTHFAAGAVSPLGISICWPDTMPDIGELTLRSGSSTWIRQPTAGRQREMGGLEAAAAESVEIGRFLLQLALVVPSSVPTLALCQILSGGAARLGVGRDGALSSLHFCFRWSFFPELALNTE